MWVLDKLLFNPFMLVFAAFLGGIPFFLLPFPLSVVTLFALFYSDCIRDLEAEPVAADPADRGAHAATWLRDDPGEGGGCDPRPTATAHCPRHSLYRA